MNDEDIAIVGVACIFPGADTPSRFWQNVVGKIDCITEAPPDWQPELFYDPTESHPDRSYCNRGGFLGDLCRFDPTKYGIPPRSIEGAEPDHFIAMRCAHEALADAGVPELPINREKTGVIVGRGLFINRGWASVFQRTFMVDQVIGVLRRLEPDRSKEDFARIRDELKSGLPPANAESVPGLVHSALVGRIANRLDLRGPAFTIDAACSSALMAVDMAMRELRNGNCDAMLVGGAQVSTPGPIHIIFCYLNTLSRSGKIAPFSADANGTLLGQGCGMVVLKRRRDAERDGNRIYALLKSIGVSSDGRGAALLAPLSEGQQLAINRAYEQAEVSPLSLELIEAHGTGIPLGDRTEIQSLNACFPQADGDERRIALGAVKSMIGHLIPASGIASLIKTALAVYHRVLPPTLHAEEPNRELGIEQTRFFLCSEPRPWLHSARDTPRRAGINAFGFGGINAHAILEEHVPDDEPALSRFEQHWPAELVVISAANRQSLAARVEWLAAWVERAEGATLLDVAAACARQAGNSRVAIVADSRQDLIKKLKHVSKLLRGSGRERIQDRHGVFWYAQPLASQGRIAFVFPGEGAQYLNMMNDLCRHFPEVRRQFDLTAEALQQRTSHKPLGQILYPQPADEGQAEKALFQLEVAVAVVTAAGRGLLQLLGDFNVVPNAIVGHSSGEFGALLAAGVYRPESEEKAIEAIIAGAESARQLETSGLVPAGTLMAVGGADPHAVEKVLADADGSLTVAMDNCPNQMVIVGDEPAVATAVDALRGKGGLCERLPWDRAYHTDAFAPVCQLIDRFYGRFKLQSPEIELWSCMTASRYPDDPAAIRELAVRQWRSKVRFRETIEAMHADGVRIFVEIGPRGMLSTFIADTLAEKPHAVVPMDVQRRSGTEQLCRAVGMLVAHGVPIDLSPMFERRQPQHVDLDDRPPALSPRDPLLKLELPVLELSDRTVAELRYGDGGRHGSPSQLAVRSSPSRNDSSARVQKARALSDYQQTTRLFLQVQRNVMTARSSASGSSGTAGPSTSAEVPRSSTVQVAEANAKPWRFLDRVLEHQRDQHLTGECELDVEKHCFLQDHTFFGRGLSVQDPTLRALSIMPLAMTLEIMAEAAAELRPQMRVAALSQIVTSRWLAFETTTRRVHIAATVEGETTTRVRVVEVDGKGMNAQIAEALVEHSYQTPDLGSPKLPHVEGPSPTWDPRDLYGPILYHGPAFQGIELIDKCGPSGLRARIRTPDPELLFSDDNARDLVLPAVLIDTASQIPGVANFGKRHADGLVTLAFPNTADRVEFAAGQAISQPLTATVRYDVDDRYLRSDVEFTTADGRVVLRYLGRVEEIVHFPLMAYAYPSNPRKELCSREITNIFSGVPGIQQCTVTEVDGLGDSILVNRLWSEVLARMVLSRPERDVWRLQHLPPVHAAAWLLGRIVGKDAVRIHNKMDVCLADVTVQSEPGGKPIIVLAEDGAPNISLTHKGFYAAAVASRSLPGVGIDVEPLQDMDLGVINDAFDCREREIIESVLASYAAAWTAKEAIGKALGLGLAGGPNCIKIVSAVPQQGGVGFAAVLEGVMAERFPHHARADEERELLHATCRVHREHVLSLCLLL